ncbi:PIN domain-containing protein [Kamptonema animale CS-326]|jgi:predicted nucleic acid-binding protein|uniref:type II toxin-antitoxin system VapC family toxin n=1 Tax=Kamptonema animale TaxID=92934 RepID=UPI00232B923D|nr:PIN domain-containing protein [Kamptonema animale]MDB9512613.1 PIN domain-containing protein [Kamptonema animale CS-326]
MGQLILPSFSTIYVDTSVLIYSLEGNLDYISLLQPLWLKFQAGEIEIVSSELILMEVLVAPFKRAENFLVNAYEQLLFSTRMRLIPISQSVLRNAAQMRASSNLKTPDALHAATALSINCSVFLTNDKGFRNVPNLPTVILSEVLAS